MAASNNNKLIAKNTLFLYVRMLFILLVTLYTSRMVITALGVVDYGVFNVVAGFVSMAGFLNVTLASSVQRFYSFERSRDGAFGMRRVFSTALLIHFVMAAAILLLMETLGRWYVEEVMVIPSDRLFAAGVAYQMAVVSLLLSVMQTPFVAAVIACERFDFYALMGIAEVVLRLMAVILLTWLPFDKVIAYSVMTLGVSAVVFLIYSLSSIRHIKGQGARSMGQGYIDAVLLRRILAFSGWSLLSTFTLMVKGQGVNMLLNVFFGTVVNAARAIAYQVNAALTSFSNNVALSFRPQIISSYAADDRRRVEQLFISSSRACFILMALITMPLAVEMDYVLSLWLGADHVPDHARAFTILVLVDSLIGMVGMPCALVAHAVGRLRDYTVYPSIVGLLVLPVIWIGLRWGMVAEGAFVLIIASSLVQQVLSLWLLHRLFAFSVRRYLQLFLLPCLLFLVFNAVVPMVVVWALPPSLLRLLVTATAGVSVGIALAWFLILTQSERDMLVQFVNKRIRR